MITIARCQIHPQSRIRRSLVLCLNSNRAAGRFPHRRDPMQRQKHPGATGQSIASRSAGQDGCYPFHLDRAGYLQAQRLNHHCSLTTVKIKDPPQRALGCDSLDHSVWLLQKLSLPICFGSDFGGSRIIGSLDTASFMLWRYNFPRFASSSGFVNLVHTLRPGFRNTTVADGGVGTGPSLS